MINIKGKETSIFIENQRITLGIKLVAAFAIVYYGLFFLFMLYLGIFYNTVFDPAYLDDTVNGQEGTKVLISYVIRTLLLGVIITGLILIFKKRRYGKFIFLICTVLLIGYQIFTTTPPAWISYIIEAVLAIVMAPLKVVTKFNESVVKGTKKIKNKQKIYIKKE